MFNNQQGYYPRISPNQVNNFNCGRPPAMHSGDQWRPRGRPPRFRHANPYNFQYQNTSIQPEKLEDNYQHYCETCDRGFKSAQLLDDHLSEHQVRKRIILFD
jgi:Zinc-finger double-stranded RNA-binding